jgi:hypothetical protein
VCAALGVLLACAAIGWTLIRAASRDVACRRLRDTLDTSHTDYDISLPAQDVDCASVKFDIITLSVAMGATALVFVVNRISVCGGDDNCIRPTGAITYGLCIGLACTCAVYALVDVSIVATGLVKPRLVVVGLLTSFGAAIPCLLCIWYVARHLDAIPAHERARLTSPCLYLEHLCCIVVEYDVAPAPAQTEADSDSESASVVASAPPGPPPPVYMKECES